MRTYLQHPLEYFSSGNRLKSDLKLAEELSIRLLSKHEYISTNVASY